MKNMKKMLALLLAVVLVLGMFPVSAFAEDTAPTGTTAPVVTDPKCENCGAEGHTADTCEACTQCKQTGGHAADCALNPLNNTDPTETTAATDPTETTAATDPTETTAATDPTPVCTKCGGAHTDAECTYCIYCQSTTCVECGKCGVHGGDHSYDCELYTCPDCGKKPCQCPTETATATEPSTEPTESTTEPSTEPTETTLTTCEYCSVTLTEDAVHAEDCLSKCTCEGDKTVEGFTHAEGCPLAVKTCEHCGVALTEDAVHAEDCLSLCTCEGDKTAEDFVHGEECPLYKAPAVNEVVVEDGNTVTAEGLPEETALNVGEADEDALTSILETVYGKFGSPMARFSRRSRTPSISREITELFSYDITVLNKDGSEWQPEDEPVEITLKIPGLSVSEYEVVYVGHKHGDNVSLTAAHVDEANETITFSTAGFSTFYGFIVDFEFNGLNYNLFGGGSVMLSELMRALDLSYSIYDVKDVEFSDETLIKIEKERNDWKLTSLESFTSEEWLRIYTKDGNVTDILVTDPILKYYVYGNNDWNMGTESVSVTKSGTSSAMGTYTTNAVVFTPDDITAAANEIDSEDDVDLLIYARPGMAIGFASGIAFPDGNWDISKSNAGNYKHTNWEWVWSSGSVNYVILNSEQSTNVANVKLKVSDAVCNVRIITFPELSKLPANLKPTKVKDTLDSDSVYEVVSLPITLYNYDGKLFNTYNNTATGGNWLAFHGVAQGVTVHEKLELPWTSTNLPNSGNISTGIMKNKLVNGLPVLAVSTNTDMFSTTEYSGKTVYENVGFEYIYNKQTGYYTYSSNLNHAQFNESANTIELYNQTLSPRVIDSSDQMGRAGFYPFVDIHDAELNYYAVDHQPWQNNLTADYFQQTAQFSRDLVSTASIDPISNVDMHFGLQMMAPFYMPSETQLDANNDGVKEDIIYKFTGDDDLWVYIDDQLVLDIGGAHTAVSGEVNFTAQTVTVESYANVTASGNTYTLGETGSNKTYAFEELGIEPISEDQMHTLRIFYLERWAGVSNCRMHFNLPVVPNGSVRVEKKLENQDGNQITVNTDCDYTFRIFTSADDEDNVDQPVDAFNALANKAYTINGNEAETTNANGEFTLKAGQYAQFTGIDRFTEVYVQEVKPNDGYDYSKVKVSTDGEVREFTDLTTLSQFKGDTKVMPKGAISYVFTNVMKTSDLTVKKELTGDVQGEVTGQKYDIKVILTDPDNGATSGKVTIGGNQVTIGEGGVITQSIAKNESFTISGIPNNVKYRIEETLPTALGGYAYLEPTYSNANDDILFKNDGTDGLTSDTTVTVTNELDAVLGHLKIAKTGIQEADHHERKSDFELEERQSTIFTITGTPDSGDPFTHIDVVIFGNGEVIIRDIPVGEYTVTEKTNWSWRYTPKDGNTRSATIAGGDDPVGVTFENQRSNIYWLSGDSYKENWWGPETPSAN